MARTLGAVLDQCKGFGPGFDFMRVFLAAAVLSWHSVGIANGNYALLKSTPLWIVEFVTLPLFFALSGFLVAASATRLSLRSFLTNRGLRIVPALAVDILICALILGPLLTTRPLSEYFKHPDFFRYFANIVGWVHYDLPGVFETNPSPRVNGALWTVPFEIGCYAALSVLIALRLHNKAWALAASGFGLLIAAVLVERLGVMARLPELAAKFVDALLFDRGARLIPAFLLGALVYRLRHALPYSWGLGLAIAAAGSVLAVLGDQSLTRDATLSLIATPLMAYMIALLGLTPLPKLPFYSTGDYSYGLYLYHVPMQQTVVFLVPGAGPLLVLLISLPVTSALAALSWWCVEKPVLALRKHAAFANWMRAAHGAGVEERPRSPV
ncbi:MAG: acyltransferase [Hyphomonadaceae bacterium]|nr:acyltransferase [Hyphomonadaceae bacterium]